MDTTNWTAQDVYKACEGKRLISVYYEFSSYPNANDEPEWIEFTFEDGSVLRLTPEYYDGMFILPELEFPDGSLV